MLIERIADCLGRRERVYREWIGKPARTPGAGPSPLVLDQPHFDFIGAQTQPVAVTQAADFAETDRIGLAVKEGAVGRSVGELPASAAKRHSKVPLRQQPFGVRQHPVNARPSADGELSAGYVASFGRHHLRAAQNRHRQLHRSQPEIPPQYYSILCLGERMACIFEVIAAEIR